MSPFGTTRKSAEPSNGASLIKFHRNDAAIKKAQDLATTHSIRAQAYKVDVSNADSVQNNITQVVKDFGKIDVFVANAGEFLREKELV